MKFQGPLIAVNNMEVSKKFYTEVLQQKIIFDIGANVAFEGHFSLQENYAELVGFNKNDLVQCSKNFELYFEQEDFDSAIKHLENYSDIKYVHDVKEYEWGQRVIRFYDPDMHIIEIGECMENVVKRYLKQGMSVEEISKRTMYPIEFVNNFLING